MPVYEYKCVECGLVFDKWDKKISEAKDPETCPECASQARRVYSASVTIII